MGRPREFDIDDAVRQAMEVFWDTGYQDTSLPDLLSGMGLARGSLYKAFKDKKSLFLLALERYDQDVVAVAVGILTDRQVVDGWERICTLFEGPVDGARQGNRRGCMLCSAAAGPASFDHDIASAVQEILARMRDAFASALTASGRHRDLDEPSRLELASALTTQYIGLQVLARSKAPVTFLEATTATLCGESEINSLLG